jgi:hypothetical protein
MRDCEEVLGPEHPNLATQPNNLAALYSITGDHTKAETLYQRAIGIITRALSPEHPHQSLFRRNYANLLDSLGRHHEAARLRAEADRS